MTSTKVLVLQLPPTRPLEQWKSYGSLQPPPTQSSLITTDQTSRMRLGSHLQPPLTRSSLITQARPVASRSSQCPSAPTDSLILDHSVLRAVVCNPSAPTDSSILEQAQIYGVRGLRGFLQLPPTHSSLNSFPRQGADGLGADSPSAPTYSFVLDYSRWHYAADCHAPSAPTDPLITRVYSIVSVPAFSSHQLTPLGH